jgi:peroxiredoxin
MKKKLLVIFAPLLMLSVLYSACGAADTAEGADRNARIEIQLSGVPAGEALLLSFYMSQTFRVDSAAVDGAGRLVFENPEGYEPGLFYVLFSDQTNFQFLIGEDQEFRLQTEKGNIVEAMQIEGSTENELLYDNLRFEADYQPRFQRIAAQLQQDPENADLLAQREKLLGERQAHLQALFTRAPNSLFTAYKRAGQNPEVRTDLPQAAQVWHYRNDFFANVDFSDPRLLHTPVIYNKLNRYLTELTLQQADSIIAASDALLQSVLDEPEYYQFFANWIAVTYEPGQSNIMDPDAVFVHLVDNYFTYERSTWADSAETYALRLRAAEMENSLVGQPGPNVTAPGPDGQLRTLYDLTAPYLVVFLYNPTCDHCREQAPVLTRLYQEQGADKTFDVYAIALDTDDRTWKDFIQRFGMPFTNVFDPSNRAIYQQYYVDNTPEVYVLDPERKIIAKNINVSQLPQVIERDQTKE